MSAAPSKTFEMEHEYVDLGLPSGTLWASCNVGANSPEEYGDYFAWGETSPKEVYDWDTYKYGKYDSVWEVWEEVTKYCTSSSFGTVDNKTELDPSDDAATANWGCYWCMPTLAQQDELRLYCTWSWTSVNGVNGKLVVGPNGNSIFLPAAGYHINSSLLNAGTRGYYWSSSLGSGDQMHAYYVFFTLGSNTWDDDNRDYGRSVRPVRASANNSCLENEQN